MDKSQAAQVAVEETARARNLIIPASSFLLYLGARHLSPVPSPLAKKRCRNQRQSALLLYTENNFSI